MNTTITLLGKEYKMAMNFGALIGYERISGKNALDYEQFRDGRIEPILTLGYSMLAACNDEAPEMDAILTITDHKEIENFIVITTKLYLDFLTPKEGDKKDHGKEKAEEDPKNV